MALNSQNFYKKGMSLPVTIKVFPSEWLALDLTSKSRTPLCIGKMGIYLSDIGEKIRILLYLYHWFSLCFGALSYEIQISQNVRGKGLGKYLMNILKLIAQRSVLVIGVQE